MKMVVTVQLGSPKLSNYPNCTNESDCVKLEQENYDLGITSIESYLKVDNRPIVIFKKGT